MRWLKELLGFVGNGRPGDFDLARKMGAEIETIRAEAALAPQAEAGEGV